MTLEFNLETPRHNNTRHRSRTMYWAGSDQRDRWETNLKNPSTRQYLEDNGWLDEHAITYTYNSHGFRTQELDSTPGYLALGCSFTEGVGLGEHQIWPTMMSNMLGARVWNLGIGGASLDTCFRMLDYYINHMSVMGVFLLQPPQDRFELHTPNWIKCFIPAMAYNAEDEEIFKSWITDERNSSMNVRKNMLAIKRLCQEHTVKLVTRQCSELNAGIPECLARDMMHFGEKNQKHIADVMYRDWKDVNS